MMKYLIRRIHRELKRIKWRAIGSMILIIFATAMYGATAAMIPSVMLTMEDKLDELEMPDLWLRVSGANETDYDDLISIDGVRDAEQRLHMSTRADFEGKPGVVTDVIGIEPRQQRVGRLEVTKGRLLSGSGDEVVVEQGFAQKNGIDIGEKVTVVTPAGPHVCTVVGRVLTSEYIFMPVSPFSMMPLPGEMAVLFMPLSELQSDYNLTGIVNEYVISYEDGVDDKNELRSRIVARAPGAPVIIHQSKEENYGYALIKEDISSGDEFMAVFAVLLLSIAFFIVYSSFMRLVDEQRREIGVLRAIGFTRGQVFASYVYLAFILGIMSSLVGLVLAYPFGRGWAEWYMSFMISMPLTHFSIDPLSLAIIILFGPVTAVLASAIATWRTVSMEPQEAIRGGGRQKVKARSGTRRSSPVKDYITLYTFRNIGRNKVRFVLTAVAVGGSIALSYIGPAMYYGFQDTIDEFVDRQEWDVIVDYSYPLDQDNATQLRSLVSADIQEAELFAKVGGQWQRGDKRDFALIVAYELGQSLHKKKFSEGREIQRDGEVLLQEVFATKEGLKRGDTITLIGDRNNVSLEVVGIVREMAGTMFISHGSLAQLFGMPVYTGMYVKADASKLGTIKSELKADPRVATVTDKDKLRGAFDEMMQQSEALLAVFAMIGVLVAWVTISNLMLVSILERYTEYGSLRALGYTKRSVSKSIVMEVMLIVAVGMVLSIPISWASMKAYEPLMREFFPAWETIIDWPSMLVIFGVMLGFALLAAWPGVRHVNRMKVAEVITSKQFG